MPLIFSYGSLQQEAVQLRTYGRTLSGMPDALPGYAQVLVPILDPVRRAVHNQQHYADVVPVYDLTRKVAGTLFEITHQELLSTDQYEALDHYTRIDARMESGRQAWVYVYDLPVH